MVAAKLTGESDENRRVPCEAAVSKTAITRFVPDGRVITNLRSSGNKIGLAELTCQIAHVTAHMSLPLTGRDH
jgi:hypothetical protein